MDGFNPAQRKTPHTRILMALIVWAVLATVFGLYTFLHPLLESSSPGDSTVPNGKHNVIFMVSDGMGPASVALARNFFEHTLHGDDDNNNSERGGHISDLSTIALDKHFIGNSRTQSSNSYITDSAAGATAFSCALKTYNGAIGVDKDAKPCATIMEAAKLQGYRTGLVVTTRITDATPASFAAHAKQRSEEDFIAEQLVNHNDAHPFGPMVDVILGGGRCHFVPRGAPGSCRGDEKDLIGTAVSDGWHLIEDMEGLRAMDMGLNVPSLPVLGLFAAGDIPFSIDHQDDNLPHLNDTARTAVNALAAATKDSDQGFFLLVEGSRIDHAGHSNDPAAQVHEVLVYSEVVDAMIHYAKYEADVPTIVVSTSDHETGGLSVSRQVTSAYPDYLWRPEVLAHAKHSAAHLSHILREFTSHSHRSRSDIVAFIKAEIVGPNGLGFSDVTEEELQSVVDHRHSCHDVLTQMLNTRAQVGWSTHGHSGVDVNVYGGSNYPHALDELRGSNENINIGKFLGNFLHVKASEITSLTASLRKKFGDKF